MSAHPPSTHPYYDAKTNQDDPKWYMVDLTFASRATHFVSLALLKQIADGRSSELPTDLCYIGEHGINVIKGMALLRKARLSVQRVDERTWDMVEMLAGKGGWDNMEFGKNGKMKEKKEVMNEAGTLDPAINSKNQAASKHKRKRKVKELDGESNAELLPRPSTRARTL